MNATEMEIVIAARNAYRCARCQRERSAAIEQAMRLLSCSKNTLYKNLKTVGLVIGKKRKVTAGETDALIEDLRLISGAMRATYRDNGKQLWGCEKALDNLRASGSISTTLSPSRIMALLRRHGLHPEQLASPKPTVRVGSLHPNHVWQIDSSTSVLYKDKSGVMASISEAEYNKNKLANYARVSPDLVTRFLVVDHTSGAMKGRCYLGGETAENLIDFFIWAISKQASSPMHGVPFMVYTDQGPGNKSNLFVNLCRNLRVDLRHHEAGRANATGSVEKHHDIWERHVEGSFRFFSREQLTLDFINGIGEEWAAHYCSTKKHKRHGRTRYGVWMGIEKHHLRTVDAELVRELASSEPVTRRVENDLSISFAVKGFGARRYSVSDIPGVRVRGTVLVSVNMYRAPALDVQVIDPDTGEEFWQTVEPIETNEYGFDVEGPTFGQEHRQARNTEVDDNRNRVEREAYRHPLDGLPSLEEAKRARKRHEQAYAGVVDPMADVRAAQVPTYLPRLGTALATPTREVAPVLLGVVAICMRLKTMMGDAYEPAATYDWVNANYPNGAAERQIEHIRAAIAFDARTGTDSAAPGGLHIVGGSA